MQVSYITAGNSQFQEVRRTVSHHLLKSLHIQTKVLYKNTKDITQKGLHSCLWVFFLVQRFVCF